MIKISCKRKDVRKFNGKEFNYRLGVRDKVQAKAIQKAYQSKGNYTRVVPGKKKGKRIWRIFTRFKKHNKA